MSSDLSIVQKDNKTVFLLICHLVYFIRCCQSLQQLLHFFLLGVWAALPFIYFFALYFGTKASINSSLRKFEPFEFACSVFFTTLILACGLLYCLGMISLSIEKKDFLNLTFFMFYSLMCYLFSTSAVYNAYSGRRCGQYTYTQCTHSQ